MVDRRSDIRLADVLETYIKKITDHFDDDWLIQKSDKGCDGTKLALLDKSLDNYHEAWGYDRHSFIEMFMCVRGLCAIKIGDFIYDIKEGGVCLIPPDKPHSEMVKNNQDYLAIWLAVHLGKVRVHLSGKDYKNSFFVAGGRFIEFEHAYNFLLNAIESEADGGKPYQEKLIKACIIQLLIVTLRRIQEQQVVELDYEGWKEAITLEVKEFIESNYGSRLKLSDISQEVCVSANHLNTIFKGITGQTIMQYLENYRLEKARCLLCNTSESIKDISDKLGYYDQYHFSKAFKKDTGYSPTQYRKIYS